jgi:hypothetical protein
MAITNFMNLDLPTVSTTLGPEWASDLNEALEVIDAHDHTSEKGVPVPVAGLNIDEDLDFEEHRATNLLSTQYDSRASTLTGAANASSIYVVDGDLYYTNSAGTAVQITDGGSLLSTPGTVQTLEGTSAGGDLAIAAADTFVAVDVDTTATRTITLPLASAVSAGRLYLIKDVTGSATDNPITLAISGSDTIDGESSVSMESDFGCIWVRRSSATTWTII